MAISSILPTTISLPTRPLIPPTPISSLRVLSPSTTHLTLSSSSSSSSSSLLLLRRRSSSGYGGVVAPVRMGGGPRTFPGGVSKWQWKRMQAKKGKQLLKARLCRERQIYEMRKRAELRSAAAELERPWEAPPPAAAAATTAAAAAAETLFSVSADEQVKALADRFRRPGGFDAWNDRDGPQIFRKLPPTEDGNLPSARFFPKGAVHSLKPYREVGLEKGGDDLGFGIGERHRRRRTRRARTIDAEISDSTREINSSDDDAFNRNGDQMMTGIDKTVHRNSRLRNSNSDDDAFSRNGDQMMTGIDKTVHRNSRLRNSNSLRPTADLSNLSIYQRGFESKE